MCVCVCVCMLLVNEETVLLGMIYGNIEIGKCYGMEMKVERIKVMRLSRGPSPVQIMIHENEPNSVEYFNYSSSIVAMVKTAFTKKSILFISTLDLNLRKKLVNCCIWCIDCKVPKRGHLGK